LRRSSPSAAAALPHDDPVALRLDPDEVGRRLGRAEPALQERRGRAAVPVRERVHDNRAERGRAGEEEQGQALPEEAEATPSARGAALQLPQLVDARHGGGPGKGRAGGIGGIRGTGEACHRFTNPSQTEIPRTSERRLTLE